MSPFVRISVHENKFYDSIVINDGHLNPVFNDKCTLSVLYPDAKKIEVVVYDMYEPSSCCICCDQSDDENDHIIGQGEFNLIPLLKEENHELTNDVDLEFDDKPVGTIRIKIRYEQDDAGLERYVKKEEEDSKTRLLKNECL